MRWTTRPAVVAALTALLLYAPVAARQQAEQAQRPPIFRSGAELVLVEAVVTDAEGRLVHDLGPSDFELIDRRTSQPIVFFQEFTAPPLQPLPPDRLRSPARAATNDLSASDGVVVLVLDDLHVTKDHAERARQAARQIVMGLAPTTLVSLVSASGDFGVEPTNNRDHVLEVIEQFEGRVSFFERRGRDCATLCAEDHPRPPGQPSEMNWAIARPGPRNLKRHFDDDDILGQLRQSVSALEGLDYRRKTLIWISEGTSIDPEFFEPGYRAIAGDLAVSTHKAVTDFYHAARLANVAAYVVDPRGEAAFGAEGLAGSGLVFADVARNRQDGLSVLAGQTGGFALVDSDDFAQGVGRILDEVGNYYQLGFYADGNATNDFRAIAVRATRPGLTVRHRLGYRLRPELAGEAGSEPADILETTLESALPTPGIPMRALATAVVKSHRAASAEVVVEATWPASALPDGVGHVRYSVLAIDLRKGKEVRQASGTADLTVNPIAGTPQDVTFRVQVHFDLDPGRYQLRAGIVSADDPGVRGSVYVDVNVPDAKSDLSLGDLLIRPSVVTQAVATAGTHDASWLLPFSPAFPQRYAATDTINVWAQVWVKDRRQEAAYRLSIVDEQDRRIRSWSMSLAAGSDVRAVGDAVPLEGLEPGQYRLRLDVTSGTHAASREIPITIERRGR